MLGLVSVTACYGKVENAFVNAFADAFANAVANAVASAVTRGPIDAHRPSWFSFNSAAKEFGCMLDHTVHGDVWCYKSCSGRKRTMDLGVGLTLLLASGPQRLTIETEGFKLTQLILIVETFLI